MSAAELSVEEHMLVTAACIYTQAAIRIGVVSRMIRGEDPAGGPDAAALHFEHLAALIQDLQTFDKVVSHVQQAFRQYLAA